MENDPPEFIVHICLLYIIILPMTRSYIKTNCKVMMQYWNVIIIIKFQAEILNIFVLANKMYRAGLAVSAVNYGKF